LSRSVVMSAWMPERTFSSTSAFGGGCGSGWTATAKPFSRSRSSAAWPMSHVA
jgi:hypothetical protein